MKRESFEVVIGGVVLDDGEFGVDEGEKQNVTLRPRQLHRLHRHHVAEKRKTRGAFQFPLPFAILLRRMRTLIITLTAVIFTLTAGTWNRLRASHSKKFDFLLVPLTQYGVKKIMKMTIFLFSKFLHLPFLFWP